MKTYLAFSIVLLLFVSACSPSSSTFKCQDGICLDIQINGQVQALQPTGFSIIVKTEKDISGLGITVVSDGAKLDINAMPEGAELLYQDWRSMDWIIDTKGGEEYIFTGYAVFQKPMISYGLSNYGLIASANLPSISRVTDSVSIYLDPEGRQIDESQAKIMMETELPGPTSPPDITVVVDTPYPSITPRQDTPTPTPTDTNVPYPPPGG